MKKHIVIITIMLFGLLSGGCAVVPALLTTGASFAVPQTVSLTITAVGSVQKTVLIAADERSMEDMLSDKLLTIQAQSILLTETGADMDATCLNGDIYLVGEYATPADRDSAIRELQRIKGVNSVKGVIKQMPTSLVALVEPAIADNHAEAVIESGLIAELHIKSANVDVEVVQGEAVIVGVVRDKAEADAVVDIVKELRSNSKHNQLKVTSLLAFQDAFEVGGKQENGMFALLTQEQMLASAKPVDKPTVSLQVTRLETVVGPGFTKQTVRPSLDDLYANYAPPERSTWQKARRSMKQRILTLSKAETDPEARKELITLSTKVNKDRNISIEGRLVRTLHTTTNLTVKKHIDTILTDIAPQRSKRISTLAMN